MVTVYSPEHRLQRGKAELMDGTLHPCVETPERAETILRCIREARLGPVTSPKDYGLAPVHRVHDPAFVSFLRTAYDRWQADGRTGDALPFSWPTRTFRQHLPESLDGQLGFYAFDAATPITAGTYRAALGAAAVALTAQELIVTGERAAFALCRPPGHHAARDMYGGYCFLNNAAIAAQALTDRGARVALLDLDYHHGNGTQTIFYRRADVFFVSLHADPAYEYPFFLGYADEQGEGAGAEYNLNLPLPLGTDWRRYQEALAIALKRLETFAPDALVVSLGVDTLAGDPISRFALTLDDYLTLGRRLASLGLPTLFVMEGGYALDRLGLAVVNVLRAFEEAL